MSGTVRQRRGRSCMLAALLTVAAVLLAACGGDSGAQLRVPNSGFTGVGQSNAPLDHPYTAGAMNVCTTGTTPVQITKVEPVRPSGPIRLLDWGLRRVDATHTYPTAYVGLVRETLTAEGFGHGPVTVRCSTPPRVAMDQFAFAVERTGPGLGVVRAADHLRRGAVGGHAVRCRAVPAQVPARHRRSVHPRLTDRTQKAPLLGLAPAEAASLA